MSKDGFEVVTREFTMKSGGKEVIKVRLVPLTVAGTMKGKVQAAPTTTGENYALEFDGKTSGVHIPTLDYDGTHPITIEAIVTPFSTGATTAAIGQTGGCALSWERGRHWQMNVTMSEPYAMYFHQSDSSTDAQEQKAVHVAGVFDQERPWLYVRGHRSDKQVVQGSDADFQPLRIGDSVVGSMRFHPKWGFYIGRKKDAGRFHGIIDEVRISNIARYTADFTPQKRFEPDEHTMALYHFDEGEGDVLHDSSGNGHHGKIVGAKWVRADGSPITRRAAEPTPSSKQPTGKEPPPLAVAPFDAAQAKKHQQAWADYLGVPVERDFDLGDGVKLTMVLIPPGEFMMGSTEEEQKRFVEDAEAVNNDWAAGAIPNEGPQHCVRITKPFYLGRYEVTRGQFREFVKETQYKTDAERDGKGGRGAVDGEQLEDPRFIWSADPGFAQTDDDPVMNVSWSDATAFCEWLSNKQNGVKLVLPSEAQWEYACRAGTTTFWHCGDDLALLRQCAWYSRGKTHPVGQLESNAWGLYDMHGNVLEWCEDRYGGDYYRQSTAHDPTGPSTGSYRVCRGGCWASPVWGYRSAFRGHLKPSDRNCDLGFRVASVPSSK